MGRRLNYDARGLEFCDLPLLDETFDESSANSEQLLDIHLIARPVGEEDEATDATIAFH